MGIAITFRLFADFSDILPFFSDLLGGNVYFCWFFSEGALFDAKGGNLQLFDSIALIKSRIYSDSVI